MGRIDKSSMQNNSQQFMEIFHHEGGGNISLHLKHKDFLWKRIVWKERGGRVILLWKNLITLHQPGGHGQHQQWEVSMYPWYDVMRRPPYLHGFPPKKNMSSLIMRKTPDILQNTWAILLKVLKVIRNKGSLKSSHSEEKSKEIWYPNVMWDPQGDPITGNRP